MAGKGKRLPDEGAEIADATPDQRLLSGASGPWTAQDRAQFHHADVRAQQWFLRLDQEEVRDLEFAVRLAVTARSFVKWTRRCVYALGASFAAVYGFGEKLGKLPETIQSATSGALKTFEMLRRLLGL